MYAANTLQDAAADCGGQTSPRHCVSKNFVMIPAQKTILHRVLVKFVFSVEQTLCAATMSGQVSPLRLYTSAQ